ncbi:MAG: hypothetical protein M1822_007374 [Bathelium mastoideum]|nr:MAG: hypothetical protein M1822_007374 [Bathelium mastoideum]
MLGETYGDGLWSENMANQLAWKVTDPDKAERSEDLHKIPSWSWASVKGAIDLNSRLPENWDKVATNHREGPIACKLEIRDENQQPMLTETALAIRSSLVEVQLGRAGVEKKWTVAFNGITLGDGKLDVFPDVELDMNEKAPHNAISQNIGMTDLSSGNSQDCHFALLLAGGRTYIRDSDARWSGYGLILKPCPERRPRTFQRVGMFRFHNLGRQEWRRVSTTAFRDPTIPVDEGEDTNILLE